jgi:hypothetical protein
VIKHCTPAADERVFGTVTRLARSALPMLLLLGLARCGEWLPPFETVPRPAPPADTSGTIRVGVCYNFLTTTADEVRGIAAVSCGPTATPQPVERDLSLNYCPLLVPSRATFTCVAPDNQQ